MPRALQQKFTQEAEGLVVLLGRAGMYGALCTRVGQNCCASELGHDD